MKRLFVGILTMSLIACAVIGLASMKGRRTLLRSWFAGDQGIRLTALRVEGNNSRIVISDPEVLRQLDSGLRQKEFTPGPYVPPNTCYLQLNGKWCGQASVSYSGNNVVVGVPSTTHLLEREFQYGSLTLNSQTVAVLSQAIKAAREEKQ